MFALAVSIGILSYTLMGLGLVGWLNPTTIYATLILVLLSVPPPLSPPKLGGETRRRGGVRWGLFSILFLQALVNLIGALGPELGFDALWYHTTIPKIWLAMHKITFLGGDLYYSGLPKLMDMLYVYPGAQLIHFSFGILTLIVIYKLARKYLNNTYSLLACIIFYSNLVVGWQSITAYIDLGRTFFEILALYLFLEKKYLQTAIILGLAVSTKILSLGSLPIFIILGLPIAYCLLPILIVSPWLLFNYLNTGNPVYPIFSSYLIDWNFSLNILRLADPINPIYIIILPFIILSFSHFWVIYKLLIIYCTLSFVIWFLTPHTGGGRFLMPYLPAWSVLTAILIQKNKFFVSLVIVLAIISIGYRGLANAKYMPHLLRIETEQEFLDKYLYHRFK